MIAQEDIKRTLDELLQEHYIGADSKETARVLLWALSGETDADTIASLTKLPRDSFVRPIVKRLRESGLWDKGLILEEGPLEITLLLALLCAEGKIRAVPGQPQKEPEP